jgi:hypothetical protein
MPFSLLSAGIFSALLFGLCRRAERRPGGGLYQTFVRLQQRDPTAIADLSEHQTKQGTRSTPGAFGLALCVATVFFILALASAPEIWQRAAAGYDGDSFYTLDILAGLGLALVSLVMALAVFTLALVKTLALHRAATRWSLSAAAGRASADLGVSLLLFYGFVWFSPQLYYLYYLAVLDGLSWQWVIKPVLDPHDAWDLLRIGPGGSLSEHLQGLLGRMLMLLALAAPALAAATRICHLRGGRPPNLVGIAPCFALLGFPVPLLLNV